MTEEIRTAYYEMLADDLEDGGSVETAKDIRTLSRAHRDMHQLLSMAVAKMPDSENTEEWKYLATQCLGNTDTTPY